MKRLMLLALSLSFGFAFTATSATPSVTNYDKPIAQLWDTYGHSFDAELPPPNQTALQRSHWVIDQRSMLGRTPASWLAWARSAFRFNEPSHVQPAQSESLTDAVLRMYSAVGVAITPSILTELSSTRANVPSFVSNAFSDLVGTVADTYAAQAPLARTINERLARGFDPHKPVLSQSERDLMTARAQSIVAAINVFRARTIPWFDAHAHDASLPCGSPIFRDPEGLIILGSMCSDHYTPGGLFGDPVLSVDPGGPGDTYTNSAGGACPATISDPAFRSGTWMRCNGLVMSIVASLGQSSNDTFSYSGAPAPVQGAGGPGGIGMLLKVGGSSTMNATLIRSSSPPFEPLTAYFDAGAQGFAYGGVGLLLEGTGNHSHTFSVVSTQGQSIWALGQGFGGLGGVGIASDLTGNNAWISSGSGSCYHCNPAREGFVGLYTGGVGFYGGTGILTNTGQGHETYRSIDTADNVDFYALGFAAFGGLGILGDDGGGDTYYTQEQALAGRAPGVFPDPILNCAIGAASYGGVGVVVSGDGSDSYYGASIAPGGRGAWVMDNGFGGPGAAYGVFVKHGGNNSYKMEAISTGERKISGRGLYEPGFNPNDLTGFVGGVNSFGTFVDIGGNDTFSGGPGAPNSEWVLGIDHS
ncbi:MAG: hypothetical protein ACYDCC_07285 [Actinomycetota bacterium]